MSESILGIMGQIVVATLIVVAARWLGRAEGTALPTVKENTRIYTVKWQWKLVGIIAVVFFVSSLVWFWQDFASPRGRALLLIPLVLIAVSVWATSGRVVTDGQGIEKKTLLRSSFLRWNEITAVYLHNRQGGAIEIRAGSRKIIIDFRFNALRHLLEEIVNHTKLQPTGKLTAD